MEIKVNNCYDCPFCEDHFDDFALAFDTTLKCSLAKHLELEENIIDVCNLVGDEERKIDTPKWCPMKNEKINIKYND